MLIRSKEFFVGGQTSPTECVVQEGAHGRVKGSRTYQSTVRLGQVSSQAQRKPDTYV